MKRLQAALCCFPFMFLCDQAPAAESLQQLFEKVTSVYGAAPNAIRETGTVYSVLQGEGKLLRLYQFPDRFHIEIEYPASNENRTMIGGRVWNHRAPAESMSRGAIVLQAARIALPWSMLSRRAAVVDLGDIRSADGKLLRGVEFPLDAQRTVHVAIDQETGYIVRSSGIQKMGDKVIEFATLYSDFRVQEGRVHAAREEQFAAGTKTGYSVIDKVEYLDALPDRFFAPWESARDATTTDERFASTSFHADSQR